MSLDWRVDSRIPLHYIELQMAKTGMQRQVTLRIDDALANRVEQLARRTRRRRSEVIRLALEEFLAAAAEEPPPRPIELVQGLIGRLETGVPDLGQRHREHLVRPRRSDRVIRLGAPGERRREASRQRARR